MAGDSPKPPRKRAPAKKAAPRKRAPAKPKTDPASGLPTIPVDVGGEHVADVVRIDAGRQRGRNAARHDPTSPANIALAERRNRALALRKAGLNYQQIADQLTDTPLVPKGKRYDRRDAHEDINIALDGLVLIPAIEQLKIELSRLDHALTAIWPAVSRGNVQAIDRMIKIQERRSKYLGLDSPIRHAIVSDDGGEPIAYDDPAAIVAAAIVALDADLVHTEPPALPGLG